MPKPFPRAGAWVTMGDRVGIINAISDDSADVHFTDEKGETTETASGVPVGSLSLAKRMEIPKSRRPSAALAKDFGYE